MWSWSVEHQERFTASPLPLSDRASFGIPGKVMRGAWEIIDVSRQAWAAINIVDESSDLNPFSHEAHNRPSLEVMKARANAAGVDLGSVGKITKFDLPKLL